MIAHINASLALVTVCGSAAFAQDCLWTLRDPGPIGPGYRLGTSIAYDSARARSVLFGGIPLGGGLPTDTWEWDGALWHLTALTGPSGRIHQGMTYDTVRARLVLFGGNGTTPPFAWLNDTWEWTGSTWVLASSTGPAGQTSPQLVFDSARAKTVMFASNTTGWTYEWDGSVWVERALPGPGGRSGASLAYDSTRARTILFGGALPFNTFASDVWEYDGLAWTFRQPVGPVPPARLGASLAYDSARQRVVMLGGTIPSHHPSDLDGTWEYDPAASTWFQRTTSVPGGLAGKPLIYASARARCIVPAADIYGLAGKLWEYNAVAGNELHIVQQPASHTVALYSATTFAAVAPDATSFQWYFNYDPLIDGGAISGATTATLAIGRCGLSTSGRYTLLMQGPCGPAVSASANLNVSPVGCYPNCDQSTASPVMTANDFQCYLNAYAGGASYANCDGSTASPPLTANDFQCFLNLYAAGCD